MNMNDRWRPGLGEAMVCLLWDHGDKIDASKVNSDWFLNPDIKKIWTLMMDWKRNGRPNDIPLFMHETHTDFARLWVDCLPFAFHWQEFEQYRAGMEEEHNASSLTEITDIISNYPPKEAILEMKKTLEAREKRSLNAEIAEPEESAHKYLEALEKRRDQKPELKTGFPDIDGKIWGLNRGELVTIGARTGRGKSTFLLNVARALLLAGKKVLYFSTEMTWVDKWSRLMSALTNIEAYKFRKSDFTREEWKTVVDQVGWIGTEKKFLVCDGVSLTVEQVRNLVGRVKPDVVMLDYLGMFSLPRADRMDLQVGEFMKQLKVMARSENVAVMVASQLNRNVDNRENKIPTLADLKESGSIEQESDIVILLYDDPGELVGYGRTLCASIEKNRHGGTGRIDLDFDKSILTLTEKPKKI